MFIGTYTAIVTPFRDGEIDKTALEKLHLTDASFQYVRSAAAMGLRPGRSRPAGGLPPSEGAT